VAERCPGPGPGPGPGCFGYFGSRGGRSSWERALGEGEERVEEEERAATRPELVSEVSTHATQDEIRTTGSAVRPQSTYPRPRAKATHQIYQAGLCFLRAPCTSNWQRWNDDRWWKQNRSLEAWNLGDMVGCKPQVTGRFIKYRTNEVRHLHPSHRAKCDLSFLNGAFALLLSTIHITVSQARPVLQPYLHQSTPPIGPRQF